MSVDTGIHHLRNESTKIFDTKIVEDKSKTNVIQSLKVLVLIRSLSTGCQAPTSLCEKPILHRRHTDSSQPELSGADNFFFID